MVEYIIINQYYTVPVKRHFNCRCCNKHVDIFDKSDKRVVFCSHQCEKNYWRKESKKKRVN